jgi:hypothetical protein
MCVENAEESCWYVGGWMDEWMEEDSAWFKSEKVEKTVPKLEGSDFHFRHLLFPHLLKKAAT